MPKQTNWIKVSIILVATALIFWFVGHDSILEPETPFGKKAFYSMQNYLPKFLDAKVPYDFSYPGSDSTTGWWQLRSNEWELRGYILNSFTNQQIPWRAIVRDQRTNGGVLYLEIDGQVLRRASNVLLNLPGLSR